MTTKKSFEPVERAKSPIWGRLATAYILEVEPPAIVVQLALEIPSYKPVLKGTSDIYLNIPQQSWDLY